MAIKNIVVYDAVTKVHRTAAVGDTLDATQLLSTDASNAASVGTDGGLYVAPQATFVDDQVLTGLSTNSATVALVPTTAGNGDVNYTVEANVKVSATAGNQVSIVEDGLLVPEATYAAATAPAIINDGTTPTEFYGTNTRAAGGFDGFFLIGGKKVGYYN